MRPSKSHVHVVSILKSIVQLDNVRVSPAQFKRFDFLPHAEKAPMASDKGLRQYFQSIPVERKPSIDNESLGNVLALVRSVGYWHATTRHKSYRLTAIDVRFFVHLVPHEHHFSKSAMANCAHHSEIVHG